MTLKFAVIGKTGQLARALQNQMKMHDYEAIFIDRQAVDLSIQPQIIENCILSLVQDIDAVILAAAYTAVDKAEEEISLAYAVNGAAPGAIARACQQRGIPLIHISTDYVFKGDGTTPYKTNHPTCPINSYGASKLAGEEEILSSRCRGAILRTSWVFDGQGKNFLNTMLNLAQNRTSLKVVNDQWGRPTYAGHLAQACIKAASNLCQNQTHKMACYHVSGSGPKTNWADFAQKIFDLAEKQIGHPVKVTPIPSKEFPTLAKRPNYSVLDITEFEKIFAHKLPAWETGLIAALAEKYNRE